MRPPADRRLDATGFGTDVPAAPARSVVRWHFAVAAVTFLGLVCSTLAVQFTQGLRESAAGWLSLAVWVLAGLCHAVLYYRESRQRAVRAAQLETRLVEAQMAALRQQLQPHFLFNTLHAISSLMHSDVDAADRTLVRLSDLLRMTLEHMGQHEITLQAELDFLSKYLEIEQTRFADRLAVSYDVQPEALDALVPTLLLQPLVENAIKHGIARKSGAGHIQIRALRENGKLRIEVRDDGAGLSETALTALQKGIGVSTTRARLQHQFGADFRFEFRRLDEGLAVVVALPWRTGHHPAADAGHLQLRAPRRNGPVLRIREQTP